MHVLFVAWQDPRDRRWFPVGRLNRDGSVFRFVYTRGAKEAKGFLPFGRMKDLYQIYEATELFPLFANRLLSKERREYRDLIHWLALTESEADPLALLGRTGGSRETDSLVVFPRPEINESGEYHTTFFVHGIRYLPPPAIERIGTITHGMRLFLMSDSQNQHDRLAMALRTDNPVTLVGYCPRYLTEDFAAMLRQAEPNQVVVSAKQVNLDAPVQFRLLCEITAPWPQGFRPFGGDLYTPLVETPLATSAS